MNVASWTKSQPRPKASKSPRETGVTFLHYGLAIRQALPTKTRRQENPQRASKTNARSRSASPFMALASR
jgi:hypothetical protein